MNIINITEHDINKENYKFFAECVFSKIIDGIHCSELIRYISFSYIVKGSPL